MAEALVAVKVGVVPSNPVGALALAPFAVSMDLAPFAPVATQRGLLSGNKDSTLLLF